MKWMIAFIATALMGLILIGCLATIDAEFNFWYSEEAIQLRIKNLNEQLAGVIRKKIKTESDETRILKLRDEIRELKESL